MARLRELLQDWWRSGVLQDEPPALESFADHPDGMDEMLAQNDAAVNAARAGWLAQRHVDRQEPCRGCWARYLCGGGCHHEVLNRGRVACDFIRGWLDYCLHAYVRLAEQRPQLFA